MNSTSPRAFTPLEVLLAVLVIALFAGGAIYFRHATTSKTSSTTTTSPSPTPLPAGSLQTYSNTAFGYSLQLPKTWTIQAKGTADPLNFSAPSFSSPCNYEKGERCSQLLAEVTAAEAGKSLDQLIDQQYAVPPQNNLSKVLNRKDTTFGQNQWKELDFYQKNGGPVADYDTVSINLYTLHNSQLYHLMYTEQQKDLIQTADFQFTNRPLFDQIVGSFKFK